MRTVLTLAADEAPAQVNRQTWGECHGSGTRSWCTGGMGTDVRRWPTGLPIGRFAKPMLVACIPVLTWMISAGEGKALVPAVILALGMVAFLLDSAAARIWPKPAREHPPLEAGGGVLEAPARRDNAWWFLCTGVLGSAGSLVLMVAADFPWVFAALFLVVSGLLAWIGGYVVIRGDKYALRADRAGLQFRPAYGRSVVVRWTDRSAVVDEFGESTVDLRILRLTCVKNSRDEVVDVNLNLELLDVRTSELQRRLAALLSARGDSNGGRGSTLSEAGSESES